MTQDGTIFFIMPKKISDCSGIKKFEYDMTCLTWTDSVTVNFTFRSASVDRPVGLAVESCGHTYTCTAYSLLYTDIVKGGYEIRVTSKFPVAEIEEMLQCESSPVFTFEQNHTRCTAAYSAGAWKSDRKKLKDIFNLFNLQR